MNALEYAKGNPHELEVKKRLDTQMTDDKFLRSNVTIFWLKQLFQHLWTEFRPGFIKVLPKNFDPFDQTGLIKKFKLNGLEYGNWLSQEDRYNYFLSFQIALFDLQSILQFGYNLGLNKTIGVAFGARGKSRASGHFEPDTFMINLPRYKEASKFKNIDGNPVFSKIKVIKGMPVVVSKTTAEVKHILFTKTGGVGTFGHEYGHSLDYYFGTYIEQDVKHGKYRTLTQGWSTSDTPDIGYREMSMRYDVSMIIHKLIWKNEKEYTKYYAVIKKGVQNKTLPDYWIRHVELFARAFEVYINHKLTEKGIKNGFLVQNKYAGQWPYADGETLKAIIPHFDSLIAKMRKKL